MSERIVLGTGRLRIEVWPFGARLNAAVFDGIAGLVDGAADMAEAAGPKLNHGATVAPVANRIAGAEAAIAGRTYLFAANEEGVTLLHSGAKSARSRIWQIEEQGADRLRLSLALGDMEDDFPGNRRITADWQVGNDAFTLSYAATTDAPTLVNMALHPYWSLGGRGREGQLLFVDADRYLPIDGRKIPTGEIAPVAGTGFDFRKLAMPGPGVDHNLCLNDRAPGALAVALESPALRMEIVTGAPGVQIYTGSAAGIAIEPQHWPDAPHHPHFPSILLEPGATYRQVSTYRFARP